MELVKALSDEPDRRLTNLKEIRVKVIRNYDSVMIGNLKQLIQGLRSCLFPFEDINPGELLAIQNECIKVLQLILQKKDPDIEIHFSLILPSIIMLLSTQNLDLRDNIIETFRLYCDNTGNVEQVLLTLIRSGIESENPHLRHQSVKVLPSIIQFGKGKNIESTLEFRKTIECLLLRYKGDVLESIQLSALQSLREIIEEFNSAVVELIPRLSDKMQSQLKELVNVHQDVAKQSFKINPVKPKVDIATMNDESISFGAIPTHIVQHLTSNSDWKMKLKMVEDLEQVMNDMTPTQRHHFLNYASSFIQFIEDTLIADINMKILLAGIRILKYMFKNASVAEKTNLPKLLQSLVKKLNDPKEIVRSEIERLILDMSFQLKTKSLVLNLLHSFKSLRVTKFQKESIISIIINVLLTQNNSQLNDLQAPSSFKEDNLYIQLVEPLAYLYTNRGEPIRVRYLAQECLAVMCEHLKRVQVLEALYECLADDKTLYDQFCDRLDAEKVPFYTKLNGINKLEFPLPINYLVSKQNPQKELVKYQEGRDSRGSQISRDIDQYLQNDFQNDSPDMKEEVDKLYTKLAQQKTLKENPNLKSSQHGVPPRYRERSGGPSQFSSLGYNIVMRQSNGLNQEENKSIQGGGQRDSYNEYDVYQEKRKPVDVQQRLTLLKRKSNGPKSGISRNDLEEGSQNSSLYVSSEFNKIVSGADHVGGYSANNSPPTLKAKAYSEVGKSLGQQKFGVKKYSTKTSSNGKERPNYYASQYVQQEEPNFENIDIKYPGVDTPMKNSPTKISLTKKQEDIMNLSPNLNKMAQKSAFQETEKYIAKEKLQVLDEPEQMLNIAFRYIGDPDWEKQFAACNVLRQIAYHHKEILKPGQIKNYVLALIKVSESLRSHLAKLAILTLSEFFENLGKKMDPEIEKCISVLLKKSTDTNLFLAEAAQQAMDRICQNGSETKVINALVPHADQKSAIIRTQIARCLLTQINQMGPRLVDFKDGRTLFGIIERYMTDSFPDVRYFAKKCILDMEYGENPLPNRQEITKLMSKYFRKEFNVNNGILLLERGPEWEGAQINQSFTSSVRKSIYAQGSPKKLSDKVKSENFRKSFQPNVEVEVMEENLRPQQQIEKPQIEDVGQKKMEQSLIKLKKLDAPETDEVSQVLSLLMKNQGDAKKYVYHQLLNLAQNKKNILKSHQLFISSIRKSIIFPLTQQAQPGRALNLSNTLIELEILAEVIPNEELLIEEVELPQIIKNSAAYIGATNFQAKKNVENFLNKCTFTYQVDNLVQPLCEAFFMVSAARPKIFLLEKLIDLSARASPEIMENHMFTVAYRMIDEFQMAKGRAMPNEFKQKGEKYIQLLYSMLGQKFIESAPANKLAKIFEIVNKKEN